MKLDKLLRKYNLVKKNQKKTPEEIKEELANYIPAATAMNFSDVEDFTGLNIKRVHELKSKLSSMSREERDYVISMIMLDKNLETGLPSEES